MTTPLRVFPDVESAVMDLLERWYGLNVGTATPADLEDFLPYVRVGLVAGRDDFVTDYSVLDLDVFTATRQQGYDLHEDIRARLLGRPHATGLAVIDRVRTEEKARPVPWDNPRVRRRLATYRISARRA